MRHILLLSGFDPLLIQKQHELSFPYEFYLRKVLRSLTMAKALTPVIDAFFRFARIRNKMIVVAQKR
jgi:hypothetical protein